MKKKLSKQLLSGFGISLILVGSLTLWINQTLLQSDLDNQVKNIATSVTRSLEFATEGLLEYGDTQIIQRMVQNYATLPKVIDIDIVAPDSASLVKPQVNYADATSLDDAQKSSLHNATIIFYLQRAMDTGTEQIVQTKVNNKSAFVHILPFSSSLFRNNNANNNQGNNPNIHSLGNRRGAAIVAIDLQQVKQEARKTFLTTTLTMMTGSLAILILMMILIEYYAITPLERLDQSIYNSQITGIVDLPPRHQLPNNEIRYLAETLATSIAQLRELETEKNIALRKINNDLAKLSESLELKVIARTAEITTANLELQKAKEIAQESSKAKSLFLANMSHELRTPLNAILGFTQLMSDDQSMPIEMREQINIIHANGQQLLNLINSILVAARIESVKQSLNKSKFSLNNLLDKIKVILKSKVEQKNLVFKIENDLDRNQIIETDELKLEQVLINLLNNAIKFTDVGQILLRIRHELDDKLDEQLDVKLYKEHISSDDDIDTSAGLNYQQHLQEYLVFEVEDTGIGIAIHDLDKIFQPFFQVASDHRFSEGTGLGLAIAKQFINLMGGDISVSSTLNQGSIFRFWIPVKIIRNDLDYLSGQQDQQVQAIDNQEIIQDFSDSPQVKDLSADSDALSPSISSTRLNKSSKTSKFSELGKLNILLAEDNQFNQILIIKMLEKLGYHADIANDGFEVLEKLKTKQYDIIFMDIQMPRMDGLEATQSVYQNIYQDVYQRVYQDGCQVNASLRQLIINYHLPLIIALTANASQETKESCFAVGMYDYVTKPVSIDTLNIVLHNAVSYLNAASI